MTQVATATSPNEALVSESSAAAIPSADGTVAKPGELNTNEDGMDEKTHSFRKRRLSLPLHQALSMQSAQVKQQHLASTLHGMDQQQQQSHHQMNATDVGDHYGDGDGKAQTFRKRRLSITTSSPIAVDASSSSAALSFAMPTTAANTISLNVPHLLSTKSAAAMSTPSKSHDYLYSTHNSMHTSATSPSAAAPVRSPGQTEKNDGDPVAAAPQVFTSRTLHSGELVPDHLPPPSPATASFNLLYQPTASAVATAPHLLDLNGPASVPLGSLGLASASSVSSNDAFEQQQSEWMHLPPAAAATATALRPKWQRRHTLNLQTEVHKLPFAPHIVGTYSCHGVEPVYEEEDEDTDAALDGIESLDAAVAQAVALSAAAADAHDDDDESHANTTRTTRSLLLPTNTPVPPKINAARMNGLLGQDPLDLEASIAAQSTTSPSAGSATTAATPTSAWPQWYQDLVEKPSESSGTTASSSSPSLPQTETPSTNEYESPPLEVTAVAKINQDRGGVAFPYGNHPKTALFAVYDGHGPGGELVSQFALHEIQRRLEQHASFNTNVAHALKETFVAVDTALTTEPLIDPTFAGSTACVALLQDKRLTLSNAGDSRCVCARRLPGEDGKTSSTSPLLAMDLTIDQNPDEPDEMQRILDYGGYVTLPPAPGLSARVWLDAECTQIGLAMARSIGDHAVAAVGVIAEPVITTHDIQPNDEFIILASDGVWEFLSSADAVAIVDANLHRGATKACQALIEAAAIRWHEEEGAYRDDITAIVVRLQELW